VGPVNKVVERRHIRRAAEEALTDPRLRLPVPPADLDETQSGDLPPGFGGVARSNGFAPHPTTEPAFTNLTFRVAPEQWYRTNAAKLVLVVLGLGAAVTSLVVLLWPGSTPEPQPQDGGSTSAPAPSPSASPTQSAPPIAELPPPAPAPPVGLPPDGPPPPAPPSADQMAPPAAPPRYYPPQYDQPTQEKPEIDVTRAPISVAPSITGPQAPSGSAVPGEARKRRGFF
jgi:hypothetical protein